MEKKEKSRLLRVQLCLGGLVLSMVGQHLLCANPLSIPLGILVLQGGKSVIPPIPLHGIRVQHKLSR